MCLLEKNYIARITLIYKLNGVSLSFWFRCRDNGSLRHIVEKTT